MSPCWEDGALPTSPEEDLRIWGQWLETNRGMVPVGTLPPEDREKGEWACPPELVKQAVWSLKPGKAVRTGSIPTVAWQAGVDLLAGPLAQCFQEAAKSRYPKDWSANSLFWLKKPLIDEVRP